MDCPRCHGTVTESAISCSVCGFAANGRSLQTWSNLSFLLAEMADWQIPSIHLSPLRRKYTQLLKASEIELGLRLPPPSVGETLTLREQLSLLTALQQALLSWSANGWLEAATTQARQAQLAQEKQAIEERLEEAPLHMLPTSGPKYTLRCLAEQQAVRQLAQDLYEAELLSELGWVRISAELKAAIEALEIEAGLRPAVPRPAKQTDRRRHRNGCRGRRTRQAKTVATAVFDMGSGVGKFALRAHAASPVVFGRDFAAGFGRVVGGVELGCVPAVGADWLFWAV